MENFVFHEAKVEWYERYANHPVLACSTTKGNWEKHREVHEKAVFWTQRQGGSTLYYSDPGDGLVNFYCHTPGNEEGFAGRSFKLLIEEDGETIERTIKGPWSSRPGIMNKYFGAHCVDLTVSVGEYTHYSAACTLSLAKVIIDLFNGGNPPEDWIQLVCILEESGEIYYYPMKLNWEEPKALQASDLWREVHPHEHDTWRKTIAAQQEEAKT